MHHQIERLENESGKGADYESRRIARDLERARRTYVDGLLGTHRQRVLRLMREPALMRAVELYGKRRHRRAAQRARGLLARGRRA